MDRIVNKAKNYEEALEWDILQQVNMTPQERMEIARILKEKVYGNNAKDVREWHRRE